MSTTGGNYRTNPEDVEDGHRYKMRIEGENYYVWFSPSSISITGPHENRPDRLKTRLILEEFCRQMSSIMGGHDVQEIKRDVGTVGEHQGVETEGRTAQIVCG